MIQKRPAWSMRLTGRATPIPAQPVILGVPAPGQHRAAQRPEGYGAKNCYAVGTNLTYSSRRYGAAIRHVVAC
jgi:spore germination protein YaaH